MSSEKESDGSNVKNQRNNKKVLENNLKKVVDSYIEYSSKIKTIKAKDIYGVVYSNVFFPIIDEIDGFYYLGGRNIYIVLKSKCKPYPNNENVLLVEYSSNDEILGKSPIIPFGCDKLNIKIVPNSIAKFEKVLIN